MGNGNSDKAKSIFGRVCLKSCSRLLLVRVGIGLRFLRRRSKMQVSDHEMER